MSRAKRILEIVKEESGRITVLEVAIKLGMSHDVELLNRVASQIAGLVRQGRIEYGQRAEWEIPGFRPCKTRRALVYIKHQADWAAGAPGLSNDKLRRLIISGEAAPEISKKTGVDMETIKSMIKGLSADEKSARNVGMTNIREKKRRAAATGNPLSRINQSSPTRWVRPRLYASIFDLAQGIECPRPTAY